MEVKLYVCTRYHHELKYTYFNCDYNSIVIITYTDKYYTFTVGIYAINHNIKYF